MNTNLVIIFGPPAVGKMTVGSELAKLTGYTLMHNHHSIDLSLEFFVFGHPSQKAISEQIREVLFTQLSKSDLPGVIFTFVWGFNIETEDAYVSAIAKKFQDQGGKAYYVELEADQATRLERNVSPFRMAKKTSKQDPKKSEENLLKLEKEYRMNSNPGEFKRTPYLRINNSNLSAEEAATKIKETFKL